MVASRGRVSQPARSPRRPPAPTPPKRGLLDRRDAWVLAPLRAFLGLTFVYAGLQKLADRWFFSASAPSSIQSQLRHAAQHSPIGSLLTTLSHHAVVVGLAIALAELLVGVAVLIGLWTRAAAALGMLLSIGFLLSVSWHTRPFYYGADIVFAFAWTPLVIGGAGPLSVDEIARADARDRLGLPSDPAVIIGFDTVRQLCGSYDNGRCRARRDHRCAPEGCPVLARQTPPPVVGDEIDRRTFVQKAGLAGWIGAAAVVGGGVVALIGRVAPVRAAPKPTTVLGGPTGGGAAAGAPSTTAAPAAGGSPGTAGSAGTGTGTGTGSGPAPGAGSGPAAGTGSGSAPGTAPGATAQGAAAPTSAAPTTAAPATVPAPAPPGMTALGPTSAVAVGGAASFTDPATGDPAFVVQPIAGHFVAFDATCTHQGCPVQFAGSAFQCPCHGAEFDATTGAVTRGPAGSPLRKIDIAANGGTLYAK